MRRLLAVAIVLGAMVSAGVAAQVGRTGVAPTLSSRAVAEQGPARLAPAQTVGTLRERLSSRAAVAVKPRVQAGTLISAEAAARAMAAGRYSQESGVVLDAARMEDTLTGSAMGLFSVMLTPYVSSGIAKGERNIRVFVSRPREEGAKLPDGRRGQVFGDIVFKNLPTGVHTYVVTLGYFCSSGAPAILVNQSEWHIDDLVVNKEAGTAQLLVLVDGDKQDQLYLAIGAAYPDKPGMLPDGMSVYYVQMAMVK
ncbi:MAG: hypothetical protein ACE149_16400 [Armatimonadota bacterium]